jgi:hypothetical protein
MRCAVGFHPDNREAALGLIAASTLTYTQWSLIRRDRAGHLQSIILGGVLLVAAIQIFALGGAG